MRAAATTTSSLTGDALLRRTQTIALKPEPEAAEAPQPAVEQPVPISRYERRQGDRRQGERRGMEALRAEALQSVISRVEDRNFGGLKNRVHWSRGIKAPRLILLAVALLAGGTAAYLATQRQAVVAPVIEQQVTQLVAEPRTKILVATAEIAPGQRVTAATLGWEEWPEAAVRPEYVTLDAAPDAIERMSGSVARVELLPGEPIREQKLATAGVGGLAAVLDSGMRAVSVAVSAESASGGFVRPGDRVDVVLTRPGAVVASSETVITNVRVLAINAEMSPPAGSPDAPDAAPQAQVFGGQAIATLALDPTQAEVAMTALTLGRLSLVLRSMADAEPAGGAGDNPANQAIRISSPFWAE